MNDPHVVALNYRIEHGDSIDYSEAEPLQVEEPKFRLRVDDKKVRFEFKQHYATEDEAKGCIADYIRRWEFDATLRRGNSDSFRLEFEKADIIDLKPAPGAVRLSAHSRIQIGISTKPTLVVAAYPPPPSDIAVNADAETMHQRYLGYRKGREPLGSMANFCLTALEASTGQRSGKRPAAAAMYRIDKSVLRKIGELAATKGGPDARKADGIAHAFSMPERRFLEQAVKLIVRRVAEHACKPNGHLPKISLSNLPSLENDPNAASDETR